MGALTGILSTIQRVPASYFVYSSFSFFGIHRGGELPGGWFVKALGEAGREEALVRQTLYRMERDEELVARRVGRMKFYAPSRYALAEIAAGTQKIFAPIARSWDGLWTMVHVGLRTPSLASHRERVIALLAVEGYARMDANTFVHPNAPPQRLVDALHPRARAGVTVVRGSLENRDAERELVALWRASSLKQRYQRAIRKLESMKLRTRSALCDREAFLMRFAVVFDHLGVAWDDPGLPAALLPEDWPGEEARIMASELYERLLPAAIRYADRLLEEVLAKSPTHFGVHR
jgi:phenylacetic acid degradation operon negative regulatory protein